MCVIDGHYTFLGGVAYTKSYNPEARPKSDQGRPCLLWASSRENLSSGFPTRRVSNQSPKLQRLARKLKFHL